MCSGSARTQTEVANASRTKETRPASNIAALQESVQLVCVRENTSDHHQKTGKMSNTVSTNGFLLLFVRKHFERYGVAQA
eukprot:6149212-Amphidinium_carterae.3